MFHLDLIVRTDEPVEIRRDKPSVKEIKAEIGLTEDIALSFLVKVDPEDFPFILRLVLHPHDLQEVVVAEVLAFP